MPVGGTGAFSGIATRIASFQSGAWTNFLPQRGWVAYIVDRGELRYFDGAAWQAITSAITTLPKLGINASADTVNRLSIAAQATLLNNDGAGHQLKINKATATDTASLLYQTAFSGRAEMGLAGNDMFSLKTSPNGSSFLTAMLVNQTTGAVSFPQGVASIGGSALSGLQRIRNGNFAINQRVVGGTVTLAAGAYGHDGVKAGSAGATYTFATSGLDTTLSISAGTLVLPVEDKLVEGGVYTLSWSGTATARVYQGTPSGSYGASPRITATLSANAHVYAEFGTGTVGLVQLQPGSLATQFERRPFPAELALCQRYFEKSYDQGTALGAVFSPGAGAGSLGSNALFVINLPTSAYLSGGTANLQGDEAADTGDHRLFGLFRCGGQGPGYGQRRRRDGIHDQYRRCEFRLVRDELGHSVQLQLSDALGGKRGNLASRSGQPCRDKGSKRREILCKGPDAL